MERKIIVYGNSDPRPDVGFPKEEDFIKWIKEDIFKKYKGRYHYSQRKPADIIILSRKGKAYGYFLAEITNTTEEDLKQYDRCKVTYIVEKSILFENPVQLANLGIKNYQFGKYLTEDDFDAIEKNDGNKTSYTKLVND